MADIQKGYTFANGETVTPAKLHALVDDATIADGSITTAKLANSIVTTAKIADANVTTAKIADSAVTSAKIVDGTITFAKLASITAGRVLLGNSSNTATATALSGDVTINSSGVTSIASGVIVNADIATNAAISGTKIDPDFGTQNIDTEGELNLKSSSGTTIVLQTAGDSNAKNWIEFRKHNGIRSAPTKAQFEDQISSFGYFAHDGVNLNQLAGMFKVRIEETPTTGKVPISFNWETVNFSGGYANRMCIAGNGNVGINTLSPGSSLHINGDLTLSSATTATSAATTTGGSTLPALAAGYLVVSINGTSRKIPYYA